MSSAGHDQPGQDFPAPSWGGRELNLRGYLERIAYDGPIEPTLDVLRVLHLAHATHISFENVDVLLGRAVALDLPSLERKLVERARGGYCYEQNLLFAAVLERVGFRVTGMAARVRMGSNALRPASHAILSVEVDGTSYLADVGFGRECLLQPIALQAGALLRFGSWTHRLQPCAQGLVLQSLHPSGWFDLYSFTLEPQYAVDYEVKNYFTCTNPRSPFVGRLVVQRTEPHVRHTLIDRELAITASDGSTRTEAVEASDLPALLDEKFGIRLTTDEAVALARVCAAKA